MELNHLGLPRPMTGAFASVYRLSNISGTWAVRCFLEQRDDMKERYEAIAAAVNASASDLFAKFDYLERGIKIRSDWYPVLKMEWIEGDSLDRYLDRHVKSRAKVVNLHKQFRELVTRLKASGIAHGDLQHGNILVSDSGLRLIDYDGMYVSALSGKKSHELGHRNFQHPDRGNELFFSELDNFSIWVIDLSLKALVVDPELWRAFNGGDDCLLFRHKDLKDPDESPVFRALIAHESADLSESAKVFREVIRLSPFRTPDYQADGRSIISLINQESVEVIQAQERADYGEPAVPPGTAVEIEPKTSDSFGDYDTWLASLNRRGEASKQTKRMASTVGAGLSSTARKAWRLMVSHIAPAAWARSVVDEGNREFDEGNYAGAVKLYTEAAEHLKHLKSRTSLHCEVLVRLGYCHIEKDQLGTAAHYFRESQTVAQKESLGESARQATLLLAATYFDLDQKERSFAELSRGGDSAGVPSAAVRGEREGSYGRRLTLPLMMTELGHNHLVKDKFDGAERAYESAMTACEWIKDESLLCQTSLIVARAAAGVCAAKIGAGQTEDATNLFLKHVEKPGDSQDIFRQLIRAEIKGALRGDWKFAELMRNLAHYFESASRSDEAKMAYTAALTVFRICDESGNQQMRIVDCLLGLKKSVEAVASLRETRDWPKGFSKELAEHVQSGRVDDFAHALMIATAVYDDDQPQHRFQCLDSLTLRCPDHSELERVLSVVESTEIGEKISFAELMIDLARDLDRGEREAQSKLAYAAAFKAFKRVDTSSAYGTSIMECLVAMGDLDVAANLLIEGGKMEEMVRLMINVMAGQKKFEDDALKDLMVRVVDTLLSRPQASVTEEEIKQSVALLKWCAGENSPIVESAEAKLATWLTNRELSLAHSLVEQGKFGNAISLFEKHEGPAGANVVSVQELWIMRYLSAAIIDRDRGYVTAADGYAFGCAVELLNTMRERESLDPAFALQAAELIRSARSIGADRYIEDVYSLFCRAGHAFVPAVMVLRHCLKSGMAQIIERRLNIVIDESVHFVIEDGQFKPVPSEISNEEFEDGKKKSTHISLSPQSDDSSAFRVLNRTFFLIEREDYDTAIEELKRLDVDQSDTTLVCESLILRGYCCYLRQDEAAALRLFGRAMTIARSRRAEALQYDKAALCVALSCRRTQDKNRHFRRLVEPTLTHRDLFKIATSIVGKHLSESENLPEVLANDLLNQSGKGDNTVFNSSTWRMYRAALLILGIKNRECRLQVVDCLDALKKFNAAARVLQLYVNDSSIDDAVSNLVARLARRHLRHQNLEKLIELYKKAGVRFDDAVDSATNDHLVNSLAKVLSGQAPRKSLQEIRHDLIAMFGRGRLTQQLCQALVAAVQDSLNTNESSERAERCRNDLLSIGRVIEKVDERTGNSLKELLDKLALSNSEKKNDQDETELFLAVE